MHDEAQHLRSVMRGAPASSAEHGDDDAGLPTLIDGTYTPYARASNKPLTSLHFVSPDREVRSFQYVDLDSDSRYTAECIRLCFTGSTPVRVEVFGRSLWRLYDYILQHRMSWIMTATSDFARDGEPIVSRVAFTVVKDDESRQTAQG